MRAEIHEESLPVADVVPALLELLVQDGCILLQPVDVVVGIAEGHFLDRALSNTAESCMTVKRNVNVFLYKKAS